VKCIEHLLDAVVVRLDERIIEDHRRRPPVGLERSQRRLGTHIGILGARPQGLRLSQACLAFFRRSSASAR
jgi:hypothetical protein